VLAGLLYGRVSAPYVAAIAALALVLLGLVSGQAAVGGFYIGGDQKQFMESEEAMALQEMQEEVYTIGQMLAPWAQAVWAWEDPDNPTNVRGINSALAKILFVLTVVPNFAPAVAALLAFGLLTVLKEIALNLTLTPTLAQIGLWSSVGFGVAWLVKKASGQSHRVVLAVLEGTTLVIAGHLLLSVFLDVAPPLPPWWTLASAVVSGGAAAVLSLLIVQARKAPQESGRFSQNDGR